MQNAGLAALGLDWRYLACEVDPSNLRAAIQGAQAMHFIGLNLTVPHKLLAADKTGLLLKRMEEAVDGDYQKYSVEPGSYTRRHFFGKYPELLELVELE